MLNYGDLAYFRVIWHLFKTQFGLQKLTKLQSILARLELSLWSIAIAWFIFTAQNVIPISNAYKWIFLFLEQKCLLRFLILS